MAKTSMQDEFPRFQDTTKSNISDISVPNGYRNQPLGTKRVVDTISGDTREIVNDVNLTEELQHLSVSSEERKQIIPRSGAHHCVHGQDAAIIGNQNSQDKESKTATQDSPPVNNSESVLLRDISPNEKPPPVPNVAKPGILETNCPQLETCQRIDLLGDISNSQYRIESGKNETRGNPYNREVDRLCQNEISNKVLRKAQNEYEENVSENTLEDEGFAKSHGVLELQQKVSFAPNKPAVCGTASNSTWNYVNGGTEIGIPHYKIYHKAIRKNFPRLTDELDMAAILDHVYARDIINQETYDTLINLSDTPIKCNRTSLQCLMHNKPKLPEFMELLRIKQKEMASVIDTAAIEIRSELSASVVSDSQLQQELGQGDKANITDQTTAKFNLTLKDTKSCTSTDRHNCSKIMWTFENQCGTEEQVKKMKSKFFDFREKMMKYLPNRTYSTRVKSNPYCVNCPCPKISIGEENGDLEALDILKDYLLDFESEVFDHTAKAVETHIGCIRIVVRPHDIHHLQKLYFDIVEGQTVTRINKWFREHCKSLKLPDGDVPQFGLAVNEEEVCSAKLHFAATNAGSSNVLTFPVSYTFCPHDRKWYWSADKRHWYDVTIPEVQHGIYMGKKPVESDQSIMERLKLGYTPETEPSYCLPCSLKDCGFIHNDVTAADDVECLKEQIHHLKAELSECQRQLKKERLLRERKEIVPACFEKLNVMSKKREDALREEKPVNVVSKKREDALIKEKQKVFNKSV